MGNGRKFLNLLGNQSLFRNRSDFDLISKQSEEWTSKLQYINRYNMIPQSFWKSNQ